MKKIYLTVLCCALGIVACAKREPTDAQLIALLHTERASPTGATERLDAGALTCLRAWSGDLELSAALPTGVSSEDGKKTCRGRLDGWIADAARNPDKFRFEDVSAPPVVRRALALQKSQQMATLNDPASHQIPAALTKPAPQPAALAVPDPTVDLGTAGVSLQEAETLCQQVQQKVAGGGANQSLTRFGAFCAGNLRKLRTTMESVAKSGHTAKLDTFAASATNMANNAREVLAAADKK